MKEIQEEITKNPSLHRQHFIGALMLVLGLIILFWASSVTDYKTSSLIAFTLGRSLFWAPIALVILFKWRSKISQIMVLGIVLLSVSIFVSNESREKSQDDDKVIAAMGETIDAMIEGRDVPVLDKSDSKYLVITGDLFRENQAVGSEQAAFMEEFKVATFMETESLYDLPTLRNNRNNLEFLLSQFPIWEERLVRANEEAEARIRSSGNAAMLRGWLESRYVGLDHAKKLFGIQVEILGCMRDLMNLVEQARIENLLERQGDQFLFHSDQQLKYFNQLMDKMNQAAALETETIKSRGVFLNKLKEKLGTF